MVLSQNRIGCSGLDKKDTLPIQGLQKNSNIVNDLEEAMNAEQFMGIQETLQVPKGKLAAPNSVFDETDKAFRSIITQNRDKIIELDEIDDVDEFCRQSFEFIKKQMGIENFSLKLVITDDDNCYDNRDNSIHISRNRAGPEKKNILGGGDKAEIFAGIVHELVHRLEHKEIILNAHAGDEKVEIEGQENETWFSFVQKWIRVGNTTCENVDDIFEKTDYNGNESGTEEFSKAQEFADNWIHYKSPFYEEGEKMGQTKTGEEYEEYRRQPVEARAFRISEMMANEYRKAVGEREK